MLEDALHELQAAGFNDVHIVRAGGAYTARSWVQGSSDPDLWEDAEGTGETAETAVRDLAAKLRDKA